VKPAVRTASRTAAGAAGLRPAQELALDVPRHLGALLADVHVDLAAHAELGQVDPGLDREAHAGHDLALVAGLEVVDVDAVAVHLVADGVAGAVQEVGAEAALLDVAARDVVHLVAVDGAPAGHRFGHERRRRRRARP
jgi:hypothetical protein